MTIEEAERLRQEAAEKVAEADRLVKLTELYPDLQKHTNRWRKVRYYSKTVNGQATKFDLGHSCGCCNDSPLEIWPYLETEHGRVYSDPPRFMPGEKHWMGGDHPYGDWETKFEAAGIREEVIQAVQDHFEADRLHRIEMAEDS